MTVRIVPRPIVRGLTFACWIDRTKFMARRSTPVPNAKVGLLRVPPKFPPRAAATEPNQTRKSPQQMLVRVSERNFANRSPKRRPILKSCPVSLS